MNRLRRQELMPPGTRQRRVRAQLGVAPPASCPMAPAVHMHAGMHKKVHKSARLPPVTGIMRRGHTRPFSGLAELCLALELALATVACAARSLSQDCTAPTVRKARLVDGGSPNQGRLEVSLDGVNWGTVCHAMAVDGATVACREGLGFINATVDTVTVRKGVPQTESDTPLVSGMPADAPYGSGAPLNITLFGINCGVPCVDACAPCWGGCTISLVETLFPACSHLQDVGIVCTGERLLYDRAAPQPVGPLLASQALDPCHALQLLDCRRSHHHGSNFGGRQIASRCPCRGLGGPTPGAAAEWQLGHGVRRGL